MQIKLNLQTIPDDQDYAAEVTVGRHNWGLAYGSSGYTDPTFEQRLNALKADIEWEIKLSKIAYDHIDWVVEGAWEGIK